MISENLLLAIVLLPLAGALLAGLAGKVIGRTGTHSVTILGVAAACGIVDLRTSLLSDAQQLNQNVYPGW